jgi:hypothetical protein
MAGVIVFLVWLWVGNLAILLGLEFDAEAVRQRAITGGHPPDEEPYVTPRDTRAWDDEDRRHLRGPCRRTAVREADARVPGGSPIREAQRRENIFGGLAPVALIHREAPALCRREKGRGAEHVAGFEVRPAEPDKVAPCPPDPVYRVTGRR